MRISSRLRPAVAVLLLCLFACQRKAPPPGPTPPAAGPASPVATAQPRSADPAAARAANRQGMKLYRKKDFTAARDSFRAAIAADPSHVLSHYNLACVLALTGDKAGASAELQWLDKSPDPQALRALVKAGSDADLAALKGDAAAQRLIAAAAERALFIGFQPQGRGRGATPAEVKALADVEADESEQALAVRGEGLGAKPGAPGTVVISLRAAALLDGAGRTLASHSLQEENDEAKLGSVAHLWIGQVVPDAEPEIVAHIEWQGRRMQGSRLLVLKRHGDDLAVIQSVELYRAEFEETSEDEEITSVDTHSELELRPDGTLRRHSREEKGADKTEILRWDRQAFTFVVDKPAGTRPAGARPARRR